MTNLLEKAKEIPVRDYIKLENPIFKGQTSVDNNLKYWMVFESNGVLYKTHNTLINLDIIQSLTLHCKL